MAHTLKDIMDILDEIAPFPMAEEWDNSGLQVGYLSQKIKKISMALDPTLKAVRNASDRGAQLLLTHHPLIFKPLLTINHETYPGDVIFEAIKRSVSIVAIHTNLDISRGGISDRLADLLGLEEVEVIQRKDDLSDGAGMGRIGCLSDTMPLSAVTEKVKDALGISRVKAMGPRDREISRVAVIGGSGGGMVHLASEKGADLLVTGDVRHHDSLEAERLGLALIDGGHFNTERGALKLFADYFRDRLKELGWDVTLEFDENEEGPMRYE